MGTPGKLFYERIIKQRWDSLGASIYLNESLTVLEHENAFFKYYRSFHCGAVVNESDYEP